MMSVGLNSFLLNPLEGQQAATLGPKKVDLENLEFEKLVAHDAGGQDSKLPLFDFKTFVDQQNKPTKILLNEVQEGALPVEGSLLYPGLYPVATAPSFELKSVAPVGLTEAKLTNESLSSDSRPLPAQSADKNGVAFAFEGAEATGLPFFGEALKSNSAPFGMQASKTEMSKVGAMLPSNVLNDRVRASAETQSQWLEAVGLDDGVATGLATGLVSERASGRPTEWPAGMAEMSSQNHLSGAGKEEMGVKVLGAGRMISEPSTHSFLQMQSLKVAEPQRIKLLSEKELVEPEFSFDMESAKPASGAILSTLQSVEPEMASNSSETDLPKISVDQVDRIQESIEKLSKAGGGRVTFQIEPEGLGKMTIDVRQIGQDVKVRLLVDEVQTRDLIESKIGDMVQSLSIKVGGLSEVRVDNMNASSQLSDFLSQQNSQQEMAMARDFLDSFRNSNQQFKEGSGYFGVSSPALLNARENENDLVQPLEPKSRFYGYGTKGQTLDRVA